MVKAKGMELEVSRIDGEMIARAADLLELCKDAGLMIATAESCTGGLLAAVLTDAPGASRVFEGGFVTYSNRAKNALLGVPQALLDSHGAVSEQVARAMAEGVIANSPADLAVSITGIAGPEGGTPEKPVGLVHFGAACPESETVHAECRFGDIDRAEVRRKAVLQAIGMLETMARDVIAQRRKAAKQKE